MRLTVGPLPAAVYWRRRLLVLVGLAMVILVVAYACTGDPTAGSAQPATTTTPSPGSTPSPTTTLLRPTTGTPPATTQPAYTLPVPAATGPCTDPEMEVTASAANPEVAAGQPVDVTIRIKNVSTRTCDRDVGADVQELRLLDQDRVIWSSDDCNPNTGADVRSFASGQEVSFTRRWAGTRSRAGDGSVNCSAGAPDTAATLQLVARLDQKLSAPFALRVKV